MTTTPKPVVRPLVSLACLAASIGSWALNAYVGAYLWLWFAVPLGAAPVSPYEYAGLGLLVRFAWGFKDPPDRTERQMLDDALVRYAVPPCVLAVGYVVHWLSL